MLGTGTGTDIRYTGAVEALSRAGVDLRIFGKPEVRGKRRLAVALARGTSIDEAREKAR